MDEKQCREEMDTITRKKGKKNSFSSEDRAAYDRRLEELLGISGLSEVTLRYIRMGALICGLDALARWLGKQQNPSRLLAQFLGKDVFKKSKAEDTARIVFSALKAILNEGKLSAECVGPLLAAAPAACKNKEDQWISKLHRFFYEQCLSSLNKDVRLPPLEDMGLDRQKLLEIRQLAEAIYDKMQKNNGIKPDSGQPRKILEWLGKKYPAQANPIIVRDLSGTMTNENLSTLNLRDDAQPEAGEKEQVEKGSLESLTEKGEVAPNDTAALAVKRAPLSGPRGEPAGKEDAPANNAEPGPSLDDSQKESNARSVSSPKASAQVHPAARGGSMGKFIEASDARLLSFFEGINGIVKEHENKFLNLEAKQRKKEEDYSKLDKACKLKNREFNAERSKNEELVSRLEERDRRISNLEAKIKKLGEEQDRLRQEYEAKLAEKDEDIKCLQLDVSTQKDALVAFRNSLASKLRTDYQQVRDATEEDMSIELGRIWLGSLKEIFRLLQEEGIRPGENS